MSGFLHNVGASFSRLWARSEVLDLRNVRARRLHYVLAYAFELVLYAMPSQYMPTVAPLFGLSDGITMYAGHTLFSLVIMLLWSARFKPLIRVSVVTLLVGFIPYFFMPDNNTLHTLFAIVAWAGLGGCVTAARCGYAFAANNVERLVGILLACFGNHLVRVVRGLNIDNGFMSLALPLLLAAGLVVTLSLFREKDFEVKEDTRPSDRRTVLLAMGFMIAFYTVEGYASNLAAFGDSYYLYVGLGGILGLGIFLAVLTLFKKSIWHIWNLFFAFSLIVAIMGLLLPLDTDHPPLDFCIGLLRIGMPLSLYMLGGIQNRYASYKLLKQCTVLFIVLMPLTTMGDDIIYDYFPQVRSITTLVVILAAFLGFVFTAPASYKYLFSTGWMEDFRRPDMTRERKQVEEVDRYAQYGLTPREKEVAALLLSANTVRMIAGELKISQSTVNMHTANLYKKLGIHSKAQLFRKFGVPEEVEKYSE